jgi:hypothetical protein
MDLVIKFRVRSDDAAAFVAAAERDRMKLSDWVRRRCLGLPATAPVIVESKPKGRG